MARFAPHPLRRPVVVTGASSGIGEATARALGAAGFPVTLGARRVERCEAVAADIRAGGGEACAVHLELADPGSVVAFAAAAEAAHGPTEVVVSNAGNVLLGGGIETDPDAFAREVSVNLLGAQRLVHLVGRGMVQRTRGDIVFVTSDVLERARPGMAAYVAAKWGLAGLAGALQMEMEGTGVRVSIVQPGPTMTGMGESFDPQQFAEVIDQWLAWGLARHDHYLSPDHLAEAVVAVVRAPRGVHWRLVEVEPEAPVRHEPEAPVRHEPEAVVPEDQEGS